MLSKIKEKINSHKVISFDIFDTLLLRPYVKPTDLFIHLEYIENVPNFARFRILAEQTARKLNTDREDITLDEIYQHLPDQLRYLKLKEIELERKVLFPNVEMKECFDYAKNVGKRIIICSDMYLSELFLSDCLKSKGFDGFEKIYVSSAKGKTKASGNLYKEMINDLGVKPQDILHIGDNKFSDSIMAHKSKLHYVLYDKVIDQLYKRQPAFKKYYSDNPTLGKSIVLSMMTFNNKHSSYWYNLGWNYASPVIVSYSKWIDEQVIKQNVQHLLFVARDGYMLQKIFTKLSLSHCPSTYLFAPRFVNKQNKYLLEEYKKYLYLLDIPHKNLAMIDSITMNFSSQTLLFECLSPKIKGLYWIINPRPNSNIPNDDLLLEFRQNKNSYMKEWGLMELFLTAPHPPCCSFSDGKVILAQPNKYEQNRMEICKKMEIAILDYCDTLLQIFEKIPLFITESDIQQLVDIIPISPTKQDKKFLNKVKATSDAYNKVYEPLMKYWKTNCIKLGPIVLFKKKIKNKKLKYYVLGIKIFTKNID